MTPETFAPFCCPGEVDALVLGAAGLQRLDLLRERPHAFLSFQQMLPAPCQGAVGAVARRDMDPELARACALADDAVARIAAAAEREGGWSVSNERPNGEKATKETPSSAVACTSPISGLRTDSEYSDWTAVIS